MQSRKRPAAFLPSLVLAVVSLALAACSPAASTSSGKLQVVATTTIVGDVVAQIGGELIDLTVLLPVGVDPHGYEAAPQDIVTVSDADLVFLNGLNLEEFMEPLLENADSQAAFIAVSDGVDTIEAGEHDEDEEHDEGEENGEGEEDDHEGPDPHVWMDPNQVMVWVENIANALSQADPDNADTYQAKAEAYLDELAALDEWIREQVAELEPAQRVLVTDHDALGYLAATYDFEVVGAIVPGTSTQAAPAAGELAELEAAIVEHDVAAIFVGTTVSDSMAQQLAQDLGVEVAALYTGSLSEADGPAASYLDFMRFNLTTIVSALSGGQ